MSFQNKALDFHLTFGCFFFFFGKSSYFLHHDVLITGFMFPLSFHTVRQGEPCSISSILGKVLPTSEALEFLG